MDDTKRFVKRLRDGRRTATVTAAADACGRVVLTVTIEGERDQKAGVVREIPERLRPAADHTHAIGNLAVTSVEAEAVRALGAAAQGRYNATPEGAALRLRAERQRLVDAMTAAGRAAEDIRGAAQDGDDDGLDRHYRTGAHDRVEKAYRAASVRLEEFDTAHPEVVAEIRAQRDADVRRWMDY
jgi:hypothetical protein